MASNSIVYEGLGEVETDGNSVFTQKLRKRGVKESSYNDQLIAETNAKAVSPTPQRVKSFQHALDAFYRFTRPYSIYGTIMVLLSTSLLTVENYSDFSPAFFTCVLEGAVVFILMVIYGVGVNQICDLEIDKINKPYLPLASGEFSITHGLLICSTCAIMSFSIAWRSGSPYLFWTVITYTVAGLAYSIDLPMLRWKKYPILATLSIIGARASMQTVFYIHIQTIFFGRPLIFSNAWTFGIVIVSFFSIVTALFKDIPDIEGDRRNGIQTFAAQLGEEKMFQLCVWLLELAFVVGIIVGGNKASLTWSKYTMVVGHAVLALVVWYRAKKIDIQSNVAISSFYMLLWQLMCAEYVLIPLLR